MSAPCAVGADRVDISCVGVQPCEELNEGPASFLSEVIRVRVLHGRKILISMQETLSFEH